LSGRASLAAVAVVAVAMTGCGVRGLSFVEDDRVSIVEPADRATVELPMTVRWRAEDLGPGASFAVFVDRAPQRPGRTVESLADGDAACEVDPACPDQAYFASRGVYTTADTELTIAFLPDLAEGDNRDFHEVTVVLLDGDGARIGESAFRVEFEVAREERG
jgi:hypothetical protein